MSETGEPNDVYWVERQALEESGFDLEAALRSDLIEIWYQPKIDLKHKRLVGVEAFARFRSPDGRVIPAGELIKGASSSSIVKLTEKALISALKTSVNLCEIGVDVRLAINVSVAALKNCRLRKSFENTGRRAGNVWASYSMFPKLRFCTTSKKSSRFPVNCAAVGSP
jgi:EAL domain-containing protein (putative c-di-GMP-specific phosphodiesterase class I)